MSYIYAGLLIFVKTNIQNNLAENKREYNLQESENNIKEKNNLKRLICDVIGDVIGTELVY